MIGNHRIGLLGQALLLLGVVPLPPPREPEIDIAAAEKAMQDLAAAGISGPEVMEVAGSPTRFAETAQKCLSMQAALAAHGRPSVDVRHLLAQHDELVRGRPSAMRQAAERNRRETLELRPDLRPQQAAARKAKAAKKARRGF